MPQVIRDFFVQAPGLAVDSFGLSFRSTLILPRLVNVVITLGTATGSIIGGAIADAAGWRAAFYGQVKKRKPSPCST